MRKTLKETYSELYTSLLLKTQQYITDYVNAELKKVPEKLFSLSPAGSLSDYKLSHFSYNHTEHFYAEDKATKVLVQKLYNYLQHFTKDAFWERAKAGFLKPVYDYNMSYGKGITAISISDLFDPKSRYIFDEQEAKRLQQELLKKIADEKQLVEAGTHFHCQRCRKLTPKESKIEGTILSIRTYGRGGKKMDFCSNECYSHAQMAHEG